DLTLRHASTTEVARRASAKIVNETSYETGSLARPLPHRAQRTNPERLAVAVEHIYPIPLGPTLLQERLERGRESEGEQAGFAALGAGIFKPDGSRLHIHSRPREETPFVSTPARSAQELDQVS